LWLSKDAVTPYNYLAQEKPMGIREKMNAQKSAGFIVAGAFLLAATGILAYSQWPRHQFSGKTGFYSDDDGQTWFIDSVYKTVPFDHDGKQAYRAVIYSCQNGKTQFCAYLMRHEAGDKKKLDDAVAQAAQQGKPPSSVGLFENKQILGEMEIKAPGPGHSWEPLSSQAGTDEINSVLANHNDGTLDIVYAE
jgi:hypothetical protein